MQCLCTRQQLCFARGRASTHLRAFSKPATQDTGIFDWLQAECGATVGPYKLQVGPVGPAARYRGVTCQEHVPAGSSLLRIPLLSTLVARSPLIVDEDEYRQQWLAVGLPKLAMRLLRVCHCGLLPHLQPWTHVLPSVSPMLIHRVAADQLRRVCSPWLADQAEDYLAAQQQGLEAHADELAGLGLSRADFEWAYGIAHSRAGGWNESAARYDIIFPGGDLVNHEQNCSAQTRPYPEAGSDALIAALDARARDEDTETVAGVELVAKRNIKPGEEVTIFYGKFTASEFLLDYGFVPNETRFTPGHDFDRAQTTLGHLQTLTT